MHKSDREKRAESAETVAGDGTDVRSQSDLKRSEIGLGGLVMGYESKLKNKEADDLFDAIMSISNRDECYRFFEDLCTVKEIKAMAQRYGVARLLLDRLSSG